MVGLKDGSLEPRALKSNGIGVESVRLGREVPTSADLMEAPDPAGLVRGADGARLGGIEEILANSSLGPRDPRKPHFLAPIDLQAIKAAGVTFMRSLLERVIEEQAKGDPSASERARQMLTREIGAISVAPACSISMFKSLPDRSTICSNCST